MEGRAELKLAEIEQRLSRVDVSAGQDLVHELLAAYGIPQSSITKLRNGTYDKAAGENETLWMKKVWDLYAPDADTAQLLSVLDRAQSNTSIGKLKPRFYIARNDQRIAAVDSRNNQTLDIALTDLPRHAAFFMPWAGAEKVRTETDSYIDTKVAQQMAKLYDEIIATNPDLLDTDQGRRNLNVFFSRLLFCFFAEDTGVFEDGIFTNALNNLTSTDATDTTAFLDQLFEILDTPHEQRKDVPSHFESFGYVNGSLFSDRIDAPEFSRKARNIVIDCGTLDWTAINPDIFGSMIQAVTAGEDRANLGMHYTSVENILKVVNPLFLDDLEEQYQQAEDSAKKLEALHKHLGDIKVFDPACGSGNFLIVAYKRLRGLEHRILQRLVDLDGGEAPLFADSVISLENFYGIEIDDFAHDIAKLSLWFAKHQMNQEYDDLFGIQRPLIPLTETGNITCANATRIDWETICPPTNTTYICGNPPFLGAKVQDKQHEEDFSHYFGGSGYPKELDYVSLWFLKAADLIESSPELRVGFVSTNSICQGVQVALLWPELFDRDAVIIFAHTSFLWSNNATRGAGVTCIVVGLSHSDTLADRRLYSGEVSRKVRNINPYLVPSDDNTIVSKRNQVFGNVPAMKLGSMAKDGGNLNFSGTERQSMVESSPSSAKFVKRYVGAAELLRADRRYCLWIEDHEADEASAIPEIERRLALVSDFREASKAKSTRAWAKLAHKFKQLGYEDAPCVAAPRHSSKRREYIPMGYFAAGTVISDANFAIYGAEPWLLGILQSTMHTAWVRTVAGRIKTDYRYASTICYNTFPFPDLDDEARERLDDSARALLAARERWPDRSLAELYDPDKMPANLRVAHTDNDAFVDSLYRKQSFKSDADRMELLLAMYRDLVAEDDAKKSKSKKKA